MMQHDGFVSESIPKPEVGGSNPLGDAISRSSIRWRCAMPSHRRDFIRLSALAASAVALPAHADTSPKPMRLLILGGTGLIGPHQVRYALSRGHHVTIFNRGRQKESWPGPVEELLGDRNGDLKALEGRDWDACIDNPTTLPVWVRDAARVLKGHVGRSSSSRPSRPMPP